MMHRALVLCLALAFLPASSAAGPPAGKGKGAAGPPSERGGSKAGAERPADLGDLLFGAKQERLIRDWFRDESHLAGLPPGLAKREELPPGLRKQLVRKGTLPPGLEKKLHPLPGSLDALLPPLPAGARRVILGRDVILLDERTSAILDILVGAARLGRTFE